MTFTNDALFRNQDHSDKLYVVCHEPRPNQEGTEITISRDQIASVLERNKKEPYDSQLSVDDIRRGTFKDCWLLSGGVAIFDHKDRLAIGLRDGNAADPFAYSNIGAGRCDRLLRDHCNEELASELVLFVKVDRAAKWHLVRFNNQHSAFDIKDFADHHQGVSKGNLFRQILESYDASYIQDCTPTEYPGKMGVQHLTVKWEGDGETFTEDLHGYIFTDTEHRTVEFRLCLRLDLSAYDYIGTFYTEGPGVAFWKTLPEIKALVQAQVSWKSRLVTPLLEYVASL